MITTFTKNDVVRYVYEETTDEENLLLEDALMAEPELTTFFLDALEIRSLLNRIKRQPRESTVDRILDFSRNYQPNPLVSGHV
jgi:hypothetical protein